MKQVTKTPAIVAQLKAAYGPSASVNDLAVFRTSMMNTLPLRKSSGLYKGATNSVELMGQMAAAVNGESIPVNTIHGAGDVTDIVGRLFAASVENAELMGLVAIDGVNHPDIVSKMDNGTIDQVSVGLIPSSMQCSSCSFDFCGPDATFDQICTATCGNDHVMGSDAAHLNVVGLGMFYELSLVPMGAVNGARVVDPASYSEPLRLAASAQGKTAFAVEFSATPKEPAPLDTKEFTAAITASAVEVGTLTAAMVVKDTALTAANLEITGFKAKIVELEAAAVEFGKSELATVKADAEEARALVASVVVHVTAEAKKILTACGIKDHSTIPTEIPAILSLIDEKRAAFAAAIPVGGASNASASDVKDVLTLPRPTSAFSAPRF